MPGKCCKKRGKRARKHTPIMSKKQEGFFGAEYARLKAGKFRKTEIAKADLRSHLKEAKGKKLPLTTTGRKGKKRKK